MRQSGRSTATLKQAVSTALSEDCLVEVVIHRNSEAYMINLLRHICNGEKVNNVIFIYNDRNPLNGRNVKRFYDHHWLEVNLR